MAVGDLITLDRLLDALNRVEADLEPQEVDKFEAAITAASAAVRAYTLRDFTLNASGVASAREYEYDDSNYIDIDDAQAVTAVVVRLGWGQADIPINSNQWRALPFNRPVKDTLLLNHPRLLYGISPEMGFTWNLDRYEGPQMPPIIEVTAVWGWPSIPEDVQQAAVWTAASFSEDARQITSESIESFSRSINVLQPAAIPSRAKDLLDQYRRISV